MSTAIDTIPHGPEKVKELESTLPALEAAMSYTLADAIREGSSVTDQCVGNWHNEQGDVCALSAALLAIKARHMI